MSQMKKPLVKLIPLLARCAAPATAIASCLFAPVALGGPGDLDPAFADVEPSGARSQSRWSGMVA